MCGRFFKIDLHDLARHNCIKHDASLAHTNVMPGGLYAPVSVDKDLLQHLLDVSKDPDFLSVDDFVTVCAARDATLSRPLSKMHNTMSRGEIAMTVQLFGDQDGNVPKQHIQEWAVCDSFQIFQRRGGAHICITLALPDRRSVSHKIFHPLRAITCLALVPSSIDISCQ